MALLEAVVFPQDHPQRLPCCRSCGYGFGAAGELEGVMVQDGDDLVVAATPPHARSTACCVWSAGVVIGAATTTWADPFQITALPSSSSARRPVQDAAVRRRRRRRRGTAFPKEARNVDDAETQRLNHIVVERNRRRQVNQYLATLRGLMPRSYARRGDQASIVGGAINFVKELKHRLQSLQQHAEKQRAEPFASSFFRSPQYSVSAATAADASSATRRGVADVEAAVLDGHATVKVMAPRRPGQQLLLRLLLGMQLRGLAALHLNVTTTAGEMVFYNITVRMGDGCQLSSAGDVAAAVHDIVAEANAAEERAAWICTR
ncbi:hypothetical protein PR202_ga17732 [Eleusine coracana subsp. coracana]|uniref:BHLH domain-containing protein n=1 Tax=Eleusine coracana subsp. coracana TaxID=191504 RepID=A0AAV5CR10_ELECO|nr:hypothetical protein QOZ80_6AG0513920 [Eleusine coracana subsp. coracana]GJN00310.1 hypothetical protein PR202_ga17485 [Eleusine coracana subsp. coracana]GJN00542.1 hypothetical protein PR202_ga17732 [Eleusine coracana subsp. coracana]